MLIIPYGTDAPLYHWPYATIGLIVTNFIVFALQLTSPEIGDGFVLEFGLLNPIQWLTSFFMHANATHLIGNMIFLWIFGLIVEGKVGWRVFLMVYLLVGTACSCLLQLLMIGTSTGGMLGASGAIYGLMAISMIWAPYNEIYFRVFGWIFLRVIATGFEVSVSTVAFFYFASDFLSAYWGGFAMSTPLIHLTGAVIGAVVGYQMVRRRMVDCEGYDLIAMYEGRLGEKPEPTQAEIEEQQRREEQRRKEFDLELKKFENYVQTGHFELATLKLTHLKRMNGRFRVDRDLGWELVKSLVAKQKVEPAIELLEELIGHYPEQRSALLINLAFIYVQNLERPRKAIETLNRLEAEGLSAKQVRARNKIRQFAFQKIDSGQLEIGD